LLLFFIDRYSEIKDAKDDTDLLNRYCFNFTIAIYDKDKSDTLLLQFDT